MKKTLLFIFVLIGISNASQAMNTGGYYKITKLWTWGEYANGAVLIQLENQHPSCPGGYWFQDSQNSGSKNLLSMALSAYYAKAPIMIYAEEESDWPGLSSKECKVQLIVIEQ